MKHILEAQVMNKFRSHTPWGFYDLIRGHTGVDLNYHFQELPSPISGKVVKISIQIQMGNCIYIEDTEIGAIHVFAHMNRIDVKAGDHVSRGQILGQTGNSGIRSTAAHLHYEVIALNKNLPSIYAPLFSFLMLRSLNGYKGWNIDPLRYLRLLYTKYYLDVEGQPLSTVQLPPERPINHK